MPQRMSRNSLKTSKEASLLVKELLDKGKLAEARALLAEALKQGVKCVNAAIRLAVAETEEGRFEEGHALFSKALELEPSNLTALNGKAHTLMQMGLFDEAVSILDPLTKEHPEESDAALDLAACLMDMGRLDDAEKLLWKLAMESPQATLPQFNLGSLHFKKGELEKAIPFFRNALELEPACIHAGMGLSMTLLKLGRFKEAWPLWESRLRQPFYEKLLHSGIPLWKPSSSKNAKVAVHCEQGLGDSLLFARFIPSFRALCGGVVLFCPKELLPLFENMEGIEKAIPFGGQDMKSVGCASWMPLMSLASLFIDSMESIVLAEKGFVAAPQSKRVKWREILKGIHPSGPSLKAGLCWAGNPSNVKGRMRSMRLIDASKLLKVPGVSWVSLQKGPQAEEMRQLPGNLQPGIIDLRSYIEDLGDTAALIEKLDIVVTVDTAVAHLAGSLGKKTCLALCSESDWRWFAGRDDSPWYPSMRLFRQTRRGDWSSPIDRIAEELARMASSRKG